MTEAEVQAIIDRQLEIERKARAWDEALRIVDASAPHGLLRSDLDFIWGLVHPAHELPKR